MSAKEIIPLTQRAFILTNGGADLKLATDFPVVQPTDLQSGQCLVKLTHSGVCHTDLGIRHNHYGQKPEENLIGGHEGVGTIVAIAEHTAYNGVKIGDRVGVRWILNACLNCEMCLKGLEGLCYNIQACGSSVNGTFCEYVVAYVNWVIPIPDGLDSPTAATIMCSGATVYSALQQSNAHIGDWLVVSGAGGGLGHLAIQYAAVMGMRVIAIDSGSQKRELCLSLGAEVWIDFRETADVGADVRAATDGKGAHAAIVTGGGSNAYAAAAMYLRPSGYLMIVGVPRSEVLSLPIMLIAGRGITIRGVFAGNRLQAREAVNIAASGKVKCHYLIRDLSDLESIYEEMAKGRIAGRIVMNISG